MGLPSIYPKWRAGTESNVNLTTIANGNILITVDGGRMFVDINNKRIEISGIEYDTEVNILAKEDPARKIYISTDTYKIYYHNGLGWVNMTSIRATAANTTKAYLIGKADDGSVIYDENIYLDTVSGNLKANTFNGYTLAAGCAKGVADVAVPTALTNTGIDLVTERKMYYATPKINGSKDYTSNTDIYAPLEVGTSGQVLTSSGAGAPIWTDQSTLKATLDGNGKNIADTYATKNNASLTGTPTAPTATNDTVSTQIATTEFVANVINAAISKINQFQYVVVDTLPASGKTGIIYLIPIAEREGEDDYYDEYVYIDFLDLYTEDELSLMTEDEKATIQLENRYERLGSTSIDLSDYVTLSGSQALTNKTYNGYTLAAACAKGVSDSSAASAIGTGSNVTTERDVYYGLPTINNAHDYTSDTNIYAPTTGGTAGYILTASSPTAAPEWTSPSALVNKLGFGFGTCATAAATVAKVVSISNFALVAGSLVSIRFTYAVPANATLNINGTGAKAIYQNNVAILDDVIEAGVIAVFVYDGTHFNLLLTDVQAGQDYYMLE